MKILVICFFTSFFIISIIGIIVKLNSINKKDNNVEIQLYNDGDLSTNLSDLYGGRLADTSVRSSVRYHKSMYKMRNDYNNYRDTITKLELP